MYAVMLTKPESELSLPLLKDSLKFQGESRLCFNQMARDIGAYKLDLCEVA